MNRRNFLDSAFTNAQPRLAGEGHFAGELFEPAVYRRSVPKLFAYLRKELGDDIELLHAAHVHLDLATWNFGIQECPNFSDALREVFPGTPEVRNGMMWCNERPGLGIDVDEKRAAEHPIRDDPPADLQWGRVRDRDGTIRRP